jgi:hypothetical protein
MSHGTLLYKGVFGEKPVPETIGVIIPDDGIDGET